MGTLEIFPAMKNKFNETDTICEKAYWILPKPLKGFSENEVSPSERGYDSRRIIWKNPIVIKETAWFYLAFRPQSIELKGDIKKTPEVFKAPVRRP